jgi:flagellar biosynthetic protein FlhB
MADDLGEKTEDPTGKRMFEARDKGQVARSADLSAAALMIFVCIYLVFFGGGIAENLAASMRGALEPVNFAESVSFSTAPTAAGFAFERLIGATVPLLAFIVVIAAISQFLQVGWHLSAKQMQPKLSNLSPAKGLKKTFSQRNAIKSVIDIGKVSLVLAVGAVHLSLSTAEIAALPMLSTMGAVVAAGKIVLEGAIWVLLVLLLIGIADMIFQKWQHTQELKMSKHEVKEERKSAEGDPLVKSRRFRMMQDLLRQQINAAVPQADVIVTNPTHFSIALKYDPETMSAPRVLAKGADHLALRIRLVAKAAGVPIVERPPLARALYHTTEPGQQIPLEHFEAVAELLAYVYRLDQRAAS